MEPWCADALAADMDSAEVSIPRLLHFARRAVEMGLVLSSLTSRGRGSRSASATEHRVAGFCVFSRHHHRTKAEKKIIIEPCL